MNRERYRLGIDIGGTFTDLVLFNESTGAAHVAKVPTTPKDLSLGFQNALKTIVQASGIALGDISFLVHGTTVATNAVIKGSGSKTALLTTKGFRDILEIGRQVRPVLYDLQLDKPKPLIRRALRLEAKERIGSDGKILEPLDEQDVVDAARIMKHNGVESVAICFLHSYANPVSELRAEETLRKSLPGIYISLSSEVCREFREYERTSTTVLNAYVLPIVANYLERLVARLKDVGIPADLQIIQSTGGVMSQEVARKKPVHLIESGPASGVMAAAYLGRMTGHDNVISFDMGGTTAKVALIESGQAKMTTDYEVGAAAHSGHISKGSGYPIRLPMIDLVEIGAGGGSIARVGAGGVLHVGPQSAEADPGPACYGLGGTDATITDANVVLGRINPDYLLGKEFKLNPQLAKKAVEENVASKLGVDIPYAASAVLRIANTNMTQAVRLVSIERGYDPRNFEFVAFGGAGPLHAGPIAKEIGIPTIIVPNSPGAFSAFGMLSVDVRHDFALTSVARTTRLDLGMISRLYESLAERAVQALKQHGIPRDAMVIHRSVDVRYVGQAYEVNVPVPEGQVSPAAIEKIVQEFHGKHDRLYGHSSEEEPTEFVTLRVTVIGTVPKPQWQKHAKLKKSPEAAVRTKRDVFFDEEDRYVTCSIYDRSRLLPGNTVEGPCVVEQYDSTTVVYPGQTAEVDEYLNLLVTVERG